MVDDTYDEGGLREAGFNDQEIAQDKSDVAQHLTAAGFSDSEVGNYFGNAPEPNMGPMKRYVGTNLKNAAAAAAPPETQTPPAGATPVQDPPHPAQGMLDALKAGFQMSTTGLLARGKMPDTVLPENAGMAMRIASMAASTAGDLPAMVAGGVFGGAAGSAVPVVGNVVGAGAGAWAAPAAIRTAYIQHLQKGDIQNFQDFYERSSAVLWDTMKAGTVGAVTALSGGAAEGALAAAPAIAQTAGKLGAELATMTTVGKAMDGQIPKPEDFLEGAVLLGGFHAAGMVASEIPEAAKGLQTKLQDVYAQTGLKPLDVIQEAASNPVVKQQLLSDSTGTPKALEHLIEDPQPGQKEAFGAPPPQMEAKVPEGLGDPSPVLGEGFAPDETPKVPVPEESSPPSEPPEPPNLDDPKEALLDRIGEEGKKPGLTFSQIYTKAMDDINPVKQLTDALTGGKEIDVKDDPFKLLRLARASGGKAETFIDHGPIDFDTLKPTGSPGLKEILQPFKGDMDGFKAYAMAARTVELSDRGIETGMPLDKANAYLDENTNKYEAGFKQLVNYQNETLAYLRDAGVVSDKGFDEITGKNERYIPFNRIDNEGSAVGSAGRGLNPIRSITGSELKIADPIESVIKNTFAYLKIAEKNRAVSALVDLAQESADGKDLVQKVPQTLKPIEVQPAEMAKYLEQYGIHEGDPEAMTIFRPLAQPLSPDEIAVMRDGKREVYNVGPDVAKALGALDYQPSTLTKVLSWPAKMIRTGAVDIPDFLARHFIRDQVNAFVMSDNNYRPVIDGFLGLKSYFSEDETYRKWMASGGGMSGIVSLDRDYIQSKVFSLSKDTGLIDKTLNVLKNPLQIMQAAAEAITSAPRIGEFARAQAAGKDLFESAYDARNVTIDNQRMGASNSVRAMSLITGFWNTRLQGVDRMVQAFQEKPAQTATKMALAVTLPSVLLWANNHQDPRYQELPDWQKDLFWIVMTKDHIFRIPKPFEQGILFGSGAERMLDAFYAHNPDAFKGFGASVAAAAIPSSIPNAFMPAIEQFANRSWLTGGTIVPHTKENVAPEYQYSPYTTETAKMLGKMIAAVPGVRDIGHGNITLASPPVIENYVRSWGGGMGQYALQLADKALTAAGVVTPPPKPVSTLADVPFIKAFVVRFPGANAQSIQDFYDNYQKAKTTFDTVQYLTKSGDQRAAQQYLASPEAQENMLNLAGFERSMSAQHRMIELIEANPDMKPVEKRQQIDGLYYQLIQTARRGNDLVKQMRKQK